MGGGSSQCDAVTKMASVINGCINRVVVSRSREIILPLFRALVRSVLEYSVQFWCLYFIKDVEQFESRIVVQKIICYIGAIVYSIFVQTCLIESGKIAMD